MNRPIKFRVFNKAFNKWFYYSIPKDIKLDGISNRIVFDKGNDWETKGEYTGLKDKNGKEIYDGDIVEVRSISVPSYIGKVIFSKGAFWIDGKGGEGSLISIPLRFEVIGNIYENKELIK